MDEGEVVVVGFKPDLAADEFNSGKTCTGQEPAPDIDDEQAYGTAAVEDEQKGHKIFILLVQVIVPYGHRSNNVVQAANQRVEDEQQEEPLVLKSNAVVRERAMVTHLEHTGVADRAVVGPSWLQLVAG